LKNLKHILYTSIAVALLSKQELESLLKQARDNNEKADVTGLLLYTKGSFMQVLEGPETSVDDIYDAIKQDTRHKDVVTLFDGPISERHFDQWAMAFNGQDGEAIEGLSDFLHPFKSKDETKIPEGKVKELLLRFRDINKH
jgi:hypothetical protein